MGQNESSISTNGNSLELNSSGAIKFQNCKTPRHSLFKPKKTENFEKKDCHEQSNIKFEKIECPIKAVNKFSSDKTITYKKLELNENPKTVSGKNKIIETKTNSLNFDIRKLYVFQDLIGGGKYGKVRTAYKISNPNCQVAIKSIKKSKLEKKDFTKLLREVEIFSSVSHKNIVQFQETYQDEIYFHIVMELCKGPELLERVIKSGHLKESITRKIVFQILSAIAYCHKKKIVHRDLKPENLVFESEDEENFNVKILDFGLSCKFFEGVKLRSILGTPYYIAPEILRGSYDEKCDLWSLGAITYLMLAGEPPFQGETSLDIFKEILKKNLDYVVLEKYFSPEATDFLKVCLERDPKKRISAKEGLKHIWFKDIYSESSLNEMDGNVFEEKTKNHKEVLGNLLKFRDVTQFEKIVLKNLSDSLSPLRKVQIQETFDFLDTKKMGRIGFDEILVAFKDLGLNLDQRELKKIFEKIDNDHDGKIEFSDFLVAGINKKNIDNEKLKQTFNLFDFDNSGFIEKRDLEKVFLSLGKEIVHKKDLDEILKEAVPNNDKEGSISLPQFLYILGK